MQCHTADLALKSPPSMTHRPYCTAYCMAAVYATFPPWIWAVSSIVLSCACCLSSAIFGQMSVLLAVVTPYYSYVVSVLHLDHPRYMDCFATYIFLALGVASITQVQLFDSLLPNLCRALVCPGPNAVKSGSAFSIPSTSVSL
ncbi:hypothetical protein JTB14_016120 [Gonioctena quinquepunctata]|nr:hypothetical protein JTB14_016120 [Gonioctena quinquepunctata]